MQKVQMYTCFLWSWKKKNSHKCFAKEVEHTLNTDYVPNTQLCEKIKMIFIYSKEISYWKVTPSRTDLHVTTKSSLISNNPSLFVKRDDCCFSDLALATVLFGIIPSSCWHSIHFWLIERRSAWPNSHARRAN